MLSPRGQVMMSFGPTPQGEKAPAAVSVGAVYLDEEDEDVVVGDKALAPTDGITRKVGGWLGKAAGWVSQSLYW